MDLNEIKEIIKADGGKFIIVENDKPEFVVMSFDDFKKGLIKKNDNAEKNHNPQIQKIKKENYGMREGENEIPEELEDEPLKIEDIPF